MTQARVEAIELSRIYRGSRRRAVLAVDRLNLAIGGGEVFGLVGESGSGKSTTARLLMGLERPTSGRVLYRGWDPAKRPREFRRQAQLIFQDPYAALNPALRVLRTVTEPLAIHGVGTGAERRRLACRWLERVGLTPPRDYLDRFPHELSGGQRQRVAIARALILEPAFVAADEPTSMLDLSVQAGILNLLVTLQQEMGLGCLFITHDLAVARHVSHRIGVMFAGRLVEQGPAEAVVGTAAHPYTRQLLAAAAVGVLTEEVSFTAPSPDGCRFGPRCPRAGAVCREQEPFLTAIGDGHLVACHFPG